MNKMMIAIGVSVLAFVLLGDAVNPDKYLKAGDTGASVTELQKQINAKLDQKGLLAIALKIQITGIFDTATIAALNYLFPDSDDYFHVKPWQTFKIITINNVKAIEI